MKNLYPLLFGILLTGVFPEAALAQYQLMVTEPYVQEVQHDCVWPAEESWGFGSPSGTVPLEATVAWASPDSMARTANVGNLTGKIALIYADVASTVSAQVGVCQQAGAVGVIIVDTVSPLHRYRTAASVGGPVRLPVVWVSRIWARQLRPALNAGTLRAALGSPAQSYFLHLALKSKYLAVPPQFALPARLVVQVGDLAFRVGGLVDNQGISGSSDVIFKAEVWRMSPNPARLYKDSVQTNLLAGDSSWLMLRPFDLVVSDPANPDRRGHYQLRYSVRDASGLTDPFLPDTRRTYDFYLTEDVYSRTTLKEPAQYVNSTPQFSAFAQALPGPLRVGYLFRTGSTAARMQEGMAHVRSASAAGIPSSELLAMRVYEWTDANQDNTPDENEVTEIGMGLQALPIDGQEHDLRFALSDVLGASPGVPLQANRLYFLALTYESVRPLALSVLADRISYGSLLSQRDPYDEYALPLHNGLRWVIYYSNLVPSMQFRMEADVTGTHELQQHALVMGPNPATDAVHVRWEGAEGEVEVADMTGRTCYRTIMSTGAVSIPVKSLPDGLYTVRLRTAAAGVLCKTLSVVH